MPKTKTLKFTFIFLLLAVISISVNANPADTQQQSQTIDQLHSAIDKNAKQVEKKVINWRRDFHQHPELGNNETRTAKIIADHLRSLGIETYTDIAHTGVVGILKGGHPGRVVALRADMDALPITEETNLPFASKVHTVYEGKEVGVMHACGHDAHMAILMGVAEILSNMRQDLSGTVKFIFQPAEEGVPNDEDSGAKLMIKEGVLKNPKPDVIFALHVFPFPVGQIHYRPAAYLAGADTFEIMINGHQTHGALPWRGVDPIVIAAETVMELQTIVSREVNLTESPAVISIGAINGGDRFNIIPQKVKMQGTIRTFDPKMQNIIHDNMRRMVNMIAKSEGAEATISINDMTPAVYNDPKLTAMLLPTFERVVGKDNVVLDMPVTTSDDFARFQQEIPGLYFEIGVTPKGMSPGKVAINHSSKFFVDESGLMLGMRALANLTVDYMASEDR